MSPLPRQTSYLRDPPQKQQQFLIREGDAVLVQCDHSIPWTKGIGAGLSGELLVQTADSSLRERGREVKDIVHSHILKAYHAGPPLVL